MADNTIMGLLNANKDELEKLLRQYKYLEISHKNLTDSIKENIKEVNDFYKGQSGVIENMAFLWKGVPQDINALNNALEEQSQKLKQVDAVVEKLANNYNLTKEQTAEVLSLLQQQMEIEEKINSLGDVNTLSDDEVSKWLDYDDALKKVKSDIAKFGYQAQQMAKDLETNQEPLNEFKRTQDDLHDSTSKLIKVQKEYNESLGGAVKKAEDFKKSAIFQVLSTGWNILTNIFAKGKDKWLEIDQAGRDFGRSIGMSSQQLDKHVSSIYDNYGSMAAKLGMEFKEIYKFQTGYSEATEKAVILTNEQVTTMASMSRNVGEQAISTASKNLDVFATSADATIEYLGKGSARAAMEGLHVKKYSEAFANNIKMASKYTFKNGISGIEKMTLLSQKLKFNMESIGVAMDKFSTLEGAIEAGAKLQVLGGAFAQNFGNPLEAMSEALLDGEAFTKRIIDTVAKQAKFDEKTGEINLSVLDKQRLKAAASAFGVGYDELFNMSTQSKRAEVINAVVAGKKLTESQKAFLANKAQYNKETQKWHLTDVNGEMIKKDISQMSSQEIDKMRSKDTYEKIISSDVRGMHLLLQGKGKSELSKLETIKGVEENILSKVGNILDSLSSFSQWVIAFLGASTLFNGITSLGGRLLSRGVNKGLNSLIRRKGPSSMGGAMGTSNALGKSKLGKLGQKINNGTRSIRTSYRAGLYGKDITQMTKASSAMKVANSVGKGMKFLKGSGGMVGGALAVGLGALEAYNAHTTYDKNKEAIINNQSLSLNDKAKMINDEKKSRNKSYGSAIGGAAGGILGGMATGAMVGSSVPIVGTIVGLVAGAAIGTVGALVGGEIGESVTEDVNETLKEVKESSNSEGGSYVDENQNDEEKVHYQIENIEKLIGNIDSKLSMIHGTLSSVNTNGNYNIRGKVNNAVIQVSDMKVNVGGSVKIISDVTSNTIDITKLFKDDNFRNGIIGIMKDALKTSTIGRSIEK